MEIRIIRSHRRRRTVSARMDKDVLLVNAPAILSQHRLEKIVMDFKSRFEKKAIKDELDRQQDLTLIARRLNKDYFDNALKINTIEYVTNQESKFGCCNYRSGNIRVSHKIGLMPSWVRDYVVMHELAHLIEPNHGRAFWDIVSRYKLAERARGYLMAIGLEKTEEGLGNAKD